MTDTVLIIEDDTVQQHILKTMLKRSLGLPAITVSDGHSAIDILRSESGQNIRLVILDMMLPVMSGIEILEIIQQTYKHIPVIMITGSRDAGLATEAINKGAIDFITKPFQSERLITTVKNALKMTVLTKEVERLSKQQARQFTFANLIGHDGGLSQYVGLGRKAAQTSIPILITGETGVGKEVFAQAIHGESDRHGKPFITVNCGAIPGQLVESILFGHEKGAFTGATEKTMGKFREAEGGTIFLDEVGELPLDAQVKLLRVLQQQEVEPVGAGKALPVNVRIVSATNRDLETEVREGRFREDLYFRLNVFEINLPPLRDRREDIPLLTRHFIDRFAVREGVKPCQVSADLDKLLMRYTWPGNVRDLENAISRAIVMDDDGILEREDFDRVFIAKDDVKQTDYSDVQDYSIFTGDEIKPLSLIEQDVMHIVLKHYDNNITKAAKALGMAKSTFYRKLSQTESKRD